VPLAASSTAGHLLGVLAVLGLLALFVGYVRQHRHLRSLRATAARIAEGPAPARPYRPEPATAAARAPLPRPRPARSRRRPVALAAALLAAVVLVGAGVLAFRSSGDGDDAEPAATRPSGRAATPPLPTADETTIAVLNGTSVPGLASELATRAQGLGYRRGSVANAEGPAQVTVVAFPPGNRRAAQRLADQLEIDEVVPLQPSAQAVAGADADLVVIVGADRSG